MSVKEASIGHAQGRVGLRRKLTGPPRRLLGKSKTSSDMERKGKTCAWGQRSGDGKGTKEDSMPGCQDTIFEEVPLESTTKSPRKSTDSKEEETLENTMETTKSLSTEQSDVKADHSNQKHKREKQGTRKRCFSPSLICIRRWRKRAGEKEDKEGHDITFFNKQTRDFAVQPTAVYGVTSSEKQVNNCSSMDTPAMKGKDEKVKVKTWRIFKRLMIAPNDHSKTKQEQLGPEISLQDHSPCAISSKKKTVNLWRHRTKKPSPFFQERIGGTQEYIEEETIVLANRHADDITELINPNPHPLDFAREVKGHCSETLTVSVDVSVMKSEDTEVRDTIETSKEETKAYENPAPTTDKMEAKKYPENRLKQADEMLATPYPIETYSCAGNDGVNLVSEVEEVQRHSSFSESVTSSTVAAEDPSLGGEFTLNAFNKHIDLNAICEDAFVHNGIKAIEENTPTSIIVNESVKEDSHLESNMCDDVHLYPIELNNSLKTGCDTFHEILNAENNGDSKQNCDVQQKEVHLLETACSVVQVVITAALDQLRVELVNSDTTLTQEEKEC